MLMGMEEAAGKLAGDSGGVFASMASLQKALKAAAAAAAAGPFKPPKTPEAISLVASRSTSGSGMAPGPRSPSMSAELQTLLSADPAALLTSKSFVSLQVGYGAPIREPLKLIVLMCASFAFWVGLLRWTFPTSPEALAQLHPWGADTYLIAVATFTSSVVVSLCQLLLERDEKKRSLEVIILAAVSMAMMTYICMLIPGVVPVLLDFTGRPLVAVRYLQWMHTTPCLLFLAGRIAKYPERKVWIALLCDEVMVISGFLASYLPLPFNMGFLAISMAAFAVVLKKLYKLFEVNDAESSFGARRIFRVFTLTLWCLFAINWVLAAMDLYSVRVEETVYICCDFFAKVVFATFLLQGNILTLETTKMKALLGLEGATRMKAISELKHALTQKDRFLASMSHELRTPLHGIIGLSDSILDGTCGSVNDHLQKAVSTIRLSGARLQTLVNDILDTASLRDHCLDLKQEEVRLTAVFEDIRNLTRPLLKPEVSLVIDFPDKLPPVRGDAGRIVQIFYNLLSNSAKFTDRGQITVAAELGADTNFVSFRVSDTGIGIPDENITTVFEAFKQVDMSVTRNYGGIGLGLNLVEQLVLAHGGSISVESKIGEGTTFTLTLPVASLDETSLSSQVAVQRSMSAQGLQSRRSGTPTNCLSVEQLVGGKTTSDLHASLIKRTSFQEANDVVDKDKSLLAVLAAMGEDQQHVQILLVTNDAVLEASFNALLPNNYQMLNASDLQQAFTVLKESTPAPDLTVLDSTLQDSFECCEVLRQMFRATLMPVFMITPAGKYNDIIRGMEAGADEVLCQPVNQKEVVARLQATLRRKKLQGREVMRRSAVQELAMNRRTPVTASFHKDVTVIVVGIVGFSRLVSSANTAEVVAWLNEVYHIFDGLIEDHHFVAMEVNGDPYAAVGGLTPEADPNHLADAIEIAKSMLEKIGTVRPPLSHTTVQLRIGVHYGPIHAGVIRSAERRRCFFGASIDCATHLQSSGFAQTVHVSEAVQSRLKDKYEFFATGTCERSEAGRKQTYFLAHGNYEAALAAKAVPSQTDDASLSSKHSRQHLMVQQAETAQSYWMTSHTEPAREPRRRNSALGCSPRSSSMTEDGQMGFVSSGLPLALGRHQAAALSAGARVSVASGDINGLHSPTSSQLRIINDDFADVRMTLADTKGAFLECKLVMENDFLHLQDVVGQLQGLASNPWSDDRQEELIDEAGVGGVCDNVVRNVSAPEARHSVERDVEGRDSSAQILGLRPQVDSTVSKERAWGTAHADPLPDAETHNAQLQHANGNPNMKTRVSRQRSFSDSGPVRPRLRASSSSEDIVPMARAAEAVAGQDPTSFPWLAMAHSANAQPQAMHAEHLSSLASGRGSHSHMRHSLDLPSGWRNGNHNQPLQESSLQPRIPLSTGRSGTDQYLAQTMPATLNGYGFNSQWQPAHRGAERYDSASGHPLHKGADRLAGFMRSIGLEQYTELLLEEEVTLDTLPFIHEEDLAAIGIQNAGVRRRLHTAALGMLQPHMGPSYSSSRGQRQYQQQQNRLY